MTHAADRDHLHLLDDVLLRQLLLPFHNVPREADDHVVFIGLSVNRDSAEGGAFYLHGLILVSNTSAGTTCQAP